MVVIYRTINASFKFNQESVKKIITENFDRYEEEAAELANEILLGHNPKIIIREEPNYFEVIALELITAGEGSAFCKRCIKNYRVNQLERISIGCGERPIFSGMDQKKSFQFLRKRNKRPELFGGTGYRCPEGHNLISTITWRTF